MLKDLGIEMSGRNFLYPDQSQGGFFLIGFLGGSIEVSDSLKPTEILLNCIMKPCDIKFDFNIPNSFQNSRRYKLLLLLSPE